MMETMEFQALRLGMAVDTIAASLAGAKVGLTLADVPLNAGTVIGDFVTAKATFAGYAKKSVTWLAPSVADDGTVEVVGTVGEWRPTDGVTPNLIYNLWLEDSGAAILFMAGRFDGAPLPMQNALDSIVVTLRWRPVSNTLVVVVS